MSLKRKILNIFAAVVMVLGSVPMSFLSANAESELGDAPASLKSVKANKNADGVGDGTYDITLEIQGVSSNKNDATKANVVVVLDTSGSMDTPSVMTVNSTGRYGMVNGDYSNLYRESGWDCVRITNNTTNTAYSDSYCRNRYNGTRYAGSGSTRLQVAKDAINDLADELLSQNDPSSDEFKDIVEMSFIDFSTDIKNNTTHTNSTTSSSVFQNWVNATSAEGGTNWEAALTAADGVTFENDEDDEKTYIIFVSDGNPTFRNKSGGHTSDCRQGTTCPPYGTGNSDPN